MAFVKDPDAVLPFAVDWTEWLLPGDTIAASSWIDVTTGITVDDDWFTDTIATVVLSGGTLGSTYALTNRVTTADGYTDDRTILIAVTVVAPVPDLPEFCWPVDTSCVPDWDAWEVTPNPSADPPVVGVPKYTADAKARAISLAGQSMRLLTGFRIGGCPITVRPCSQGCGEQTWRTYPVRGASGSTPWYPVSLGGQWLNIGCGHTGGCACSTLHEVTLYGQVGAVTTVRVDGAVLDPTAYRVDGARLVRTDGEPWPLCQNLDAPDTEPETWSVTYTPGAPVDGLGAWAAGVLAGEYVQACTPGGQCRLPSTVIQTVRLGVTQTFAPGAFPDGKTGIREVDSYLEAVNPNGLQGPPMVWSPDLARPRTTGS